MAGFTLQRVPRNDEELYQYVRARYGFAIPRTKVCPDHCTPFQAFSDAFFARRTLIAKGETTVGKYTGTGLWHGSRGLSGKSFTLSLLATTVAELLGSDVNLLGGSFAQSANIHEHVGKALDYERAPKYMQVKRGATDIEFSNGAHVKPLTASQKTVRGPHPPRLLLDEIDEMDEKILYGSLGQPMEQRNYLGLMVQPYAVLCSTWQNAVGTFTTVKRQAEDEGWPIYQWCYRESANPIDGWLTPEAIELKRLSIPKAMWDAEYELNEPSGEIAAIDPAKTEATFCLPLGDGYPIMREVRRDYEQYVFEQPDRNGAYAIGADWARKQDYTVIVVGRVDVKPARIVYYCRVNRRPWGMMTDLFNTALRKYQAGGRCEAWYDATGIGDVVGEMLDLSANPFLFSGAQRNDMLTEYISAVEQGKWNFPKIPSLYTATKYASVDDVFRSGDKYHLPDEFAACALMEHARRQYTGPVAPETVSRTPEVASTADGAMGPLVGRLLDAEGRPLPMGEVQRLSDADQYGVGSEYSLTV